MGSSVVDLQAPLNGTVENISWSPDGSRVALLVLPILLGTSPNEPAESILPHIVILEAGSWTARITWSLKGAFTEACVAWSPDSQHLAIAEPGEVGAISIPRGEYESISNNKDLIPYAVKWDGNQIYDIQVAATYEATPYLGTWIAAKEAQLHDEFYTETTPLWASWSPDRKRLVVLAPSARSYGRPQFNLLVSEPQGTSARDRRPTVLPLPPGIVENVGWSHLWSPDSHMMAVTTEPFDDARCTLVKWNGANEFSWKEIEFGPMSLFGSCWSPDGTLIAATTGDQVAFFAASTLEMRSMHSSFFSTIDSIHVPSSAKPVLDQPDEGEVSVTGFTRSLAWSPDGRWFLAGNVGGMRIWTLDGS